MGSEGLVLQKLQHSGGQGFGNAVDLVQKQNALLLPGPVHGGVYRADDLAHGILRHGKMLPAVVPLRDFGQAYGALPGVVGHGVGHHGKPRLPGRLLHDGGLSHPGRADQQQGPLVYKRIAIIPVSILLQIGRQGVFDFFFCFLNIHRCSPIGKVPNPVSGSSPTWAPVPDAFLAPPVQKPSHNPAAGGKSRLRP